jgi:hypothetical protein
MAVSSEMVRLNFSTLKNLVQEDDLHITIAHREEHNASRDAALIIFFQFLTTTVGKTA